jgi:hypothetical protein
VTAYPKDTVITKAVAETSSSGISTAKIFLFSMLSPPGPV